MIRLWFREPHRVNPARPRPLPAGRGKRPTARTVVPPISAGGGGSKNSGCSMSLLKFAAALIAVGVLILVFRYFAPVLLLAALPTREWRRIAQSPGRPSSADTVTAWRLPADPNADGSSRAGRARNSPERPALAEAAG